MIPEFRQQYARARDINTLFYGLILWLWWSTPFATRRLIRKRRGRCVRCGYDLTGTEHDVCPECGRVAF